MQYIYLIYKFLVCLVLSEKKIFSVRINYYILFFQTTNIVKFIFYLFDKNINPFKSNEFIKFIKTNKKKWEELKKNITVTNGKKIILIENFLNTDIYQ